MAQPRRFIGAGGVGTAINKQGYVLPSPPPPTWAVIAQGSSDLAGGDSVTLNTTGADLLVMLVGTFVGTQTVTINDNKGNTWLQAADGASGVSGTVSLYYCQGGVVGAGHTISMTTARTYPSMSVAAFSGSMASPLDQIQLGSKMSQSGTSSSAGPITPTASNELIITGTCTNGLLGSAAGFTSIASHPVGADLATSLAYQVQTTPVAVTGTWTGQTAPLQAIIASFK